MNSEKRKIYQDFDPPYQSLSSEDWGERFLKAKEILSACRMCPHRCGVNRLDGEVGFCQQAVILNDSKNQKEKENLFPKGGIGGCFKIALPSAVIHRGEEPVLGGENGVGNLFFAYCNSRCCFCQNAEISQPKETLDLRCYKNSLEIADTMLSLQAQGVSHIGLVTPSHLILFLLEAIFLAAQRGLSLPIIYNSNGYDAVETLKLLEGIVSIYLPDFKYGSLKKGEIYSQLKNYPEIAKRAIREMIRQCGSSLQQEKDLAVRGVIVRHLVLPNDQSASEELFSLLADCFPPNLSISLMAQYYPAYQAERYPLINRTITFAEYGKAKSAMESNGFFLGWTQAPESEGVFRPEFKNKEKPFNEA